MSSPEMATAGGRAVRSSWARVEGVPVPLGATWVSGEEAWNFAVYSEHAERVTLLLYGDGDVANPIVRLELDHLRHKSGPVWHCRIPVAAMKGARFYAYQVDGPRSFRHRFDPEKILFDPYARAVHFPQGFDRRAAGTPGSNAGCAPLGLIAADREPFDWTGDRRPRHEADAVIYELHVRGFTAHPSSGVAGDRRGTFLGLIEKIPYLVELGVTVVELMPVFQFDPGEGNYWGYNPISFFAPHSGYAHPLLFLPGLFPGLVVGAQAGPCRAPPSNRTVGQGSGRRKPAPTPLCVCEHRGVLAEGSQERKGPGTLRTRGSSRIGG